MDLENVSIEEIRETLKTVHPPADVDSWSEFVCRKSYRHFLRNREAMIALDSPGPAPSAGPETVVAMEVAVADPIPDNVVRKIL